MRIVVSGADGFLGSHILERLRQENRHDVVGITLFPEVLAERFAGWNKLTTAPANLKSMAKSAALEETDVYIACAFPRDVDSEGLADGLDFVYGSLGVMLDKGCKAVINVSSQSVYDPHRTRPAKETDRPVLTSVYAATKYCVELSVARMCQDKGVPFTNVRLASLIGPGFDQRFVNKMVRSAIETGKIIVSDNGSRFAILDVKDAAEGIVAMLRSAPSQWALLYNMGPRRSYTAGEVADVVAETVCAQTGREIAVHLTKSRSERISSEIDSYTICGLVGQFSSRDLRESIDEIMRRLGVFCD